MRVLGIESSCDETSVAIVENGENVVANCTASSSKDFQSSGGVIPEEAARKQLESILPVLHKTLETAKCTKKDIDCIAVTSGPGLLGSLLVGTTTARTLGSLWKKPVIGIHHTFGHLSSTWLRSDAASPEQERIFPILTLSASGGHTDLWLRTSHTNGELLGRTRDDAVGEAFDKGASMLGLPYPGGPSIAKAAETGSIDAHKFPSPLHSEDSLDFSFSGLKTALRYLLRDLESANEVICREDIAASYQHALCSHLTDRVHRASEIYQPAEIHLVGGVSANQHLRKLITENIRGIPVRWPERISYCTDNAAMIAAACFFLVQEKPDAEKNLWSANTSLPLSAFLDIGTRTH